MPDDISATAFSIGTLSISLALVALLFLALPLRVTSASWQDIFKRERAAQVIAVGTSILMIYFIASGRWTFGSLSSHIKLESKPLLLGAQFLAVLSLPLSGALLARSVRRRVFTAETVIMAGCVLTALAWALVSGRRNFAVALVLQGAGFLSVFWRNRPRSNVAVQAVVAAVLGVAVASAGWQTFYMMRIASYSLQNNASPPSLVEMYALSQAVDRRAADIEYAKNLATRGSIINSVTVFTSSANSLLLGEGAVNAIREVIPAMLFPGKAEWERESGGAQEILWSKRLNVPLNDWANTLFLDAYADFSVFGLPLYLLLITGMAASLRLVAGRDPFANYLILAGFMYALLNVEGGLTSFAVTTRNLFVLLAMWRLCLFFAPQIFGIIARSYKRRASPVRT